MNYYYYLIILGVGLSCGVIIKHYLNKYIHKGYVNDRIKKRIYENTLKMKGWSKKKIHKREKQLQKEAIEENMTPEEKDLKKLVKDPIKFLKEL